METTTAIRANRFELIDQKAPISEQRSEIMKGIRMALAGGAPLCLMFFSSDLSLFLCSSLTKCLIAVTAMSLFVFFASILAFPHHKPGFCTFLLWLALSLTGVLNGIILGGIVK